MVKEKYKLIDNIDNVDIYILDSLFYGESIDHDRASIILSGVRYFIDLEGNLKKDRINKEVSQYDYYNGNV